MKHPALLRMFAVCLAPSCLCALFTGAFALYLAGRDRQDWQQKAAVWELNAAEAQRLAEEKAALQSSYALSSSLWPKWQERHEQRRTNYRTALANYSATRAGLVLGRTQLESAAEGLDEAVRALQEATGLFEAGKAALEPVYTLYQQLQGSLAQSRGLYDDAAAALPAQPSPEAPQLTPEQALALTAQTHKLYAELETLLLDLQAQTPEDQRLAADALQDAASQLNEVSGELDGFSAGQLAYTASRAIYDEAKSLLDNPPEGMSEAEARAAADALCRQGLNMSFDELGDWLRENEPESAADGETLPSLPPELVDLLVENLPDDQSLLEAALSLVTESDASLLEKEAAYREDPENMDAAALLLAASGEALDGLDRIFLLVGPTIEDAWAQILDAQWRLNLAWETLHAGQKSVEDGFAELAKTEKRLARQAIEFRLRRFALLSEQKTLKRLHESVERYEELAAQERRVRDTLLENDAVLDALRGGASLAESAARSLAQEQRAQTRSYLLQTLSAALLLAAALCGAFAACACFEKPRLKRLWPPLVSTALLAAAAEALRLSAGRGFWYAGLFVLVLSAAALPFTGRRLES